MPGDLFSPGIIVFLGRPDPPALIRPGCNPGLCILWDHQNWSLCTMPGRLNIVWFTMTGMLILQR